MSGADGSSVSFQSGPPRERSTRLYAELVGIAVAQGHGPLVHRAEDLLPIQVIRRHVRPLQFGTGMYLHQVRVGERERAAAPAREVRREPELAALLRRELRRHDFDEALAVERPERVRAECQRRSALDAHERVPLASALRPYVNAVARDTSRRVGSQFASRRALHLTIQPLGKLGVVPCDPDRVATVGRLCAVHLAREPAIVDLRLAKHIVGDDRRGAVHREQHRREERARRVERRDPGRVARDEVDNPRVIARRMQVEEQPAALLEDRRVRGRDRCLPDQAEARGQPRLAHRVCDHLAPRHRVRQDFRRRRLVRGALMEGALELLALAQVSRSRRIANHGAIVRRDDLAEHRLRAPADRRRRRRHDVEVIAQLGEQCCLACRRILQGKRTDRHRVHGQRQRRRALQRAWPPAPGSRPRTPAARRGAAARDRLSAGRRSGRSTPFRSTIAGRSGDSAGPERSPW